MTDLESVERFGDGLSMGKVAFAAHDDDDLWWHFRS
jgi:hypothetical protein